MTTLYRPVLIESAEQAEALPEGTILLSGHLDEPWDLTIVYCDPDEGCPATMLDALAAGVRMTALVPIEAEEEWTAMGSDHGDPWIAHVGYDGIDGSREEAQRYVDRFGGFIAHRALTPWEEA